jgi:hypothetical protein
VVGNENDLNSTQFVGRAAKSSGIFELQWVSTPLNSFAGQRNLSAFAIVMDRNFSRFVCRAAKFFGIFDCNGSQLHSIRLQRSEFSEFAIEMDLNSSHFACRVAGFAISIIDLNSIQFVYRAAKIPQICDYN